MAGRRLVFELGHVFVFEFQMFIAALANDLSFDIHRFRSFGRLDGPLRSLQRFPCGFRQIFGQSLEICSVLVAEIELHAPLIPAIQMLSLTELAVTSHANASKAGLGADVDRFVEMAGRTLSAMNIARTIDDRKNFLCVREADKQRMIAPDSFEGDVHSFLAFTGCSDDDSIDINDRFVKKLLGLLTPDILSRGMNS
jgi:hypothetical protein